MERNTTSDKKRGINDMKHKCPICGKYEFVEHESYDRCDVCGWEDDGLQEDEPDYAGGANDMSLNEYKKAWEEGRECH